VIASAATAKRQFWKTFVAQRITKPFRQAVTFTEHAFISTVADGTLTTVWKPAKRHCRKKKRVGLVGRHTPACVVRNSHKIRWSASRGTPPNGESSKKQPLSTSVSCVDEKSGNVAFTRRRVKDVTENHVEPVTASTVIRDGTRQSANVQFESHVWLGPRPSAALSGT
jgi:hypothetical protein